LGYWGDHANQIVHQGSGFFYYILEQKCVVNFICNCASTSYIY
jgi:hypothetical protein